MSEYGEAIAHHVDSVFVNSEKLSALPKDWEGLDEALPGLEGNSPRASVSCRSQIQKKVTRRESHDLYSGSTRPPLGTDFKHGVIQICIFHSRLHFAPNSVFVPCR